MLSKLLLSKRAAFRTLKGKLYRRDEFYSYLRRELQLLYKDLPDLQRLTCRPKLVFTENTGLPFDVEFRRSGQKIIISVDWEYARLVYEKMFEHIATHYYWYAHCGPEIGPVTINISDGDAASTATLAQCAFKEGMTLLPDTHFFRNRGYIKAGKTFQDSKTKWADRSDEIIWRGSAFGCGYLCFDKEVATHRAVLQRIRLAHVAMDTEVDFKFIESYQTKNAHHVMRVGGFMGERVPEYSWINRKYAIDIDGYSNAWSNFYIRLKLGCCVLKVESEYGFRQWYYHKLEPYVHYVPVKADLSDLFSQIEWVKAHPAKAEAIATAGRLLADSMDFASESEAAVRILTAHSRKTA